MLPIPSYLDELHAQAVEKAKFDLALAKLEREAWLAMINSGQALTAFTMSGRNHEKISETPYKVLAFALHFAILPQKISKIFQHQFWHLNLYKLRHSFSRNNICRDQIAIRDSILQIWSIKWFDRDYYEDNACRSDSFLNYITVMIVLFESLISFHFTLVGVDFKRKIFDFIKVYRWEGEVLLLVLNINTNIVEGHLFDSFLREILAK